MHINPTISFGDIFNFILASTAIVALYLQRKQVAISKRDLNSKITSIQDVIRKLEEEKLERIEQIMERKKAHEIFQSSSFQHFDRLYENSMTGESNILKQLASMNHMIIIISNTLEILILEVLKDSSEENIPVLVVLRSMRDKNIAYIERNNHLIEYYEAFHKIEQDRQQLLETQKSSEHHEINEKFTERLKMLINEMDEKYKPIQIHFENAYKNFNDAVKTYLSKSRLSNIN